MTDKESLFIKEEGRMWSERERKARSQEESIDSSWMSKDHQQQHEIFIIDEDEMMMMMKCNKKKKKKEERTRKIEEKEGQNKERAERYLTFPFSPFWTKRKDRYNKVE